MICNYHASGILEPNSSVAGAEHEWGRAAGPEQHGAEQIGEARGLILMIIW